MNNYGYAQEKFINDKIDTFFGFIKSRNMDSKKYFALLFPAYKDAAAKYYESPNLQAEFSFDEYVENALRNTLASRPKTKPASNNTAVISSLDAVLLYLSTPGSQAGKRYADYPVDQNERRKLVSTIFRILNDDDKDILMMRATSGCSFEEIADVYGITPDRAVNRFSQVRQRIISKLTFMETY